MYDYKVDTKNFLVAEDRIHRCAYSNERKKKEIKIFSKNICGDCYDSCKF